MVEVEVELAVAVAATWSRGLVGAELHPRRSCEWHKRRGVPGKVHLAAEREADK